MDGWSLGIVLERELVAEEGTGGSHSWLPRSHPWVVQQREEEAGALRDAADHLACSPYRLMERFLMDGLYPSSLKCSLWPFPLPCQLSPPHPWPCFALGPGRGR